MMKPNASPASLVEPGRTESAPFDLNCGAARSAAPWPRSATRLRFELFGKACLDQLLASFLFVVTAPIVLLCMALIKLTSRGPALYSQKRVGQFGRVFTIWKLRTMYHNCEKHTGPRWSTPGDPRVTLVGKALRTLHLDELPQLMNVLRGQMSLIGPRPERPEIAAKLKNLVEAYDDRHTVLPGISGNAQIHLPPDTKIGDVREKLILDREYVNRFSAWLDVTMLFKTALKSVGLYRHRM
jgi:lipopolysaccharide/colanic/teichoic acid biosynthesis glycosyltransferase